MPEEESFEALCRGNNKGTAVALAHAVARHRRVLGVISLAACTGSRRRLCRPGWCLAEHLDIECAGQSYPNCLGEEFTIRPIEHPGLLY